MKQIFNVETTFIDRDVEQVQRESPITQSVSYILIHEPQFPWVDSSPAGDNEIR